MKPITSAAQCFSNLLLRLCRDKSGNVAMNFGLVLAPLPIAVGAAPDMTRETRLEQKMAGTTDADHYFDAADSDVFLLAFDEIAKRIETSPPAHGGIGDLFDRGSSHVKGSE